MKKSRKKRVKVQEQSLEITMQSLVQGRKTTAVIFNF